MIIPSINVLWFEITILGVVLTYWKIGLATTLSVEAQFKIIKIYLGVIYGVRASDRSIYFWPSKLNIEQRLKGRKWPYLNSHGMSVVSFQDFWTEQIKFCERNRSYGQREESPILWEASFKSWTGGSCYFRLVSSGQSYKHFTLVNYDSRVVPDWKIPHITTLELQFMSVKCF